MRRSLAIVVSQPSMAQFSSLAASGVQDDASG
jgi:hypothetical protein